MDQAAALELMAGKNRANTLAAILNNMEDLKGAYRDALGAEGSAMRENAAYLDSIQGRIDLFNNALQTMWMNLLNSDAIKWFVDLGTSLIKAADKVGILNVAVAGVVTYFTAIKKHNPVTMFKDLIAAMQNYNQIVKQIQSIGSIIGPVKNMSWDQFNAGPVNAYAAAVSNLTAKQQAATLAASGLNSEQIASVLAANGLSSANIKLAMSEAGVAQAKTQTAAATGLQIAAAMKQQGVALSQKATNFLLAHSTEEVTKKMLAKAVVAGQITHQEAVLIMKSMGVVAANTAQAFSWKALGTAISAAFKSNPIGMLISIASAVTAIVIPALDALIDSTEEVKQKAEDALTEYSNSQSELKKTKSTMDALSDDYAKLASGVDEFGNNISLSTSQYERYNEIVNQIADMFPQMVKGYTAEGNAIIKNKGNVEALTAAYESLQSVASNTLLASADDIMQNYKNTFENKWYEDGPSTDSNKIKASRELSKMLNNQDTYKFGAYFNNSKNDGIITTMVNLLEDAGIEEKSFTESSEDYVKRALTEFPGIVQSIINTWESTANAAVSNVKPLISAYLDTSVGYAGLNDQQKQVIDSMVASLDEEFFNAFDGDASKLYTALESMIQNLKTSGLDDEYNLMLNVKTSFNNDELTVKEYQDEVNTFKTKLDNLVSDGILSETDAKYIKLSIGIDDDGVTKELDSMVAYAQKIVDEESKDKILTLTYSDLQIINSSDFKVPEGTLLSWTELKEKIAAIKAMDPDINVIQTYTDLSGKMSSYNDILVQTSEITANNLEVTQEYKDSLLELGISSQDLAKCFDDENKLVVTNAKLLNTLVKNAKGNILANTKLAKSQARLQYYELYKEMKDLTGGMKITDGATLSYVESLYAQMSALEKTISQYSLLEAKLLGAANAYEQLEQAQTQDEANDYGSKAEELVTVLTDAFTTRELGTQAAQVAIEGLIPEDVLDSAKEKAKTDLDGAMQDIYDYFVNDKGVIKKLFKFEFDDDGKVSGVEMTREKVQKFTDELLKAGNVFQGEFDKATKHWDNVTFADGIDSLEDFADALGTTEEVAFAYLTELEKLDISWLAGDYASLLDMLTSNDIERAIMQNTKDLADLEYRAANGDFNYKGGYDDYVKQRTELENEASANEQAARESIAKWTSATKEIEKAQANVDKLSGELAKMDGTEADFDVKQEALEEAVQELYKAQTLLNGLEEPTEVMLTVVGENLRAEIKNIEDQLAAEGFTVDAVVQLDKESGEYKVVQNSEYTGKLDAETLKTLASLKTQELEVTNLLSTGITTAEGHLSNIDSTVQSILSEIGKSNSGDGSGEGQDEAKATVKAYISEYKEVDGGASRDSLSIDKLVGHLSSYIDETNGDQIVNSTIANLIGTLTEYRDATGNKEITNSTLNNLLGMVTSYMDATGGAEIKNSTLKALTGVVIAYEDATGGAEITNATFKNLTGIITSYADQTNGAEITNSAIKALVGTVIAYQDANGGAVIDSKTLNALVGVIKTYKDMTGGEIDGSTIKELVGIITSYKDMTGGAEITGSTLKNLVGILVSYKETKGGAPIENSTLQALAGVVVKYEESSEGVNYDDLDSIKALEAEVSEYDEALNCDKSKLLQNFVAKITAYDDSEATMPSAAGTDSEPKEITKEYEVVATTTTKASEKAASVISDSAQKYVAALQQLNAFMNAGFTASDYLTSGEAAKFGIEVDEDSFISAIEAYQYLEEQLQKREMPTVQIANFATEQIDQQIQTLQTALSSNNFTNIDPISLGLEVDANQTEIKAAIESKLATLQLNKDLLSFFVNLTVNEEDQLTVTQILEQFNQWPMNSKVVPVSASGVDATKKGLKAIDSLAAKDATKTVTVVTQQKTSGTSTSTQNSGGSGGIWSNIFGWLSGKNDVNGTAHAQGTAHKGGSWGAPKTETALTGELGPELRVRGNRWELLGENGAEFNEVRKGDIIFNHKQTEELLTNGYITGRGKAFAEGTVGGTAYSLAMESGVIGGKAEIGSSTQTIQTSTVKIESKGDTNVQSNKGTVVDQWNSNDKPSKDLSNKKNNSGSSGKKDAEDEFNEIFDWIEVRLEEINEDLSLKGAKLENVVGSTKQNAIIDDMLELNQKLYDNLTAGASEYYAFAKKLLADVPEEYRKAAQDGSIAIEEFVGEADEKTLEAIQKYREWVQKGADATQQAEEVLTEIQNLAKQAIDNIAQEYENKASIPGIKLEQLEAYNALLETDLGAESENIYKAMISANNKSIEILQSQRNKMQAELNAQVEAGNIKKYSQAWYDAVGEIAAVDTEIINLTADTEDYQDVINELHWDHFDNLLSRFEAISDEAENLIDILGNEDLVDKDTAEWTDEGIASLGLYAQQMEVAEMQAKKYKEEIQYLNKNWKKLGYTEQEYVEKLEELKEGQYDSIKAYNDTKKAIVDLTKERVDAIKEGIEKEIEAYEELISKKKEELDAEKDLYDFQKGVSNQQKEIADIERKLAALSSDNSASARAKRAQLQAELLEAQAALEDTYYDRSVSNQQEALDKELEAFQDEKNTEMEAWDEYIEDTERVVADGLATIQANTEVVYDTLQAMGQEYSLSIADALVSPWEEGKSAIQSYSEKFGLSMSATVDELKKIAEEYKKTMAEIEQAGKQAVSTITQNVSGYQSATYKEPPKKEETPATPTPPAQQEQNITLPKKGSKVKVKAGTTHWGAKSSNKKMASFVPGRTYTVSNTYGSGSSAQVLLSKKETNKKSANYGKTVYMGWINIKDLEGYAKGTTGVKNDQFAWIDELGEELVIRPSNGRMTFMEKGTGVIPADLTSNLMEWGELDPSIMLERNKPVINAPHITNNNMEINMDIAEVVHIDSVSNDTIPDLTKAIEKQLDKYMKNLNGQIRKYAR
ncbi:MAG: hypothetical protein IJ444_02095 [Kiritimatiellae bacterium]|nr:hypothetical protein [Kiritimatiellia bacterium]